MLAFSSSWAPLDNMPNGLVVPYNFLPALSRTIALSAVLYSTV